MVSSNNVTITEQGHLIVGNVGIPAAVVPAIEAYYRAKFAAERMPEDVQKLVDNAKAFRNAATRQGKLPDEGSIIGQWMATAAALEAAYSQKGLSDESR